MTTDRVLCANPMHESRKAVARLQFPDAQFTATTSCRDCVAWHLEVALDFRHSVLVEPIKPETSDG
jgi:hypothetical protein